jgi:hypothetical protein
MRALPDLGTCSPAGDVEGAHVAYQRAIESDLAQRAPSAALNLGKRGHWAQSPRW